MSELQESRRGFYVTAIYALGALISALMAIPAAIYLLVPPSAKKKEDWVDIADFSKLAKGVPEEVLFRRQRQDGWRLISERTSAWVLRTGDKEAVAFTPLCTHLGCAYHWDDRNRNFICPCHTSAFGLDGKVLTGPAPRPLDRYLVKIEGDRLMVGPVDHSREA
ncbi:MAG: ubiquinol-cytochrome c reductase iron-sulfur subunit [Bryobacteraceae bacterium]